MADGIRLEWDQANVKHIARHSIVPGEIAEVFKNDPVDIDFDAVNGEERWTSVGHTDSFRVVVVVGRCEERACDRSPLSTPANGCARSILE